MNFSKIKPCPYCYQGISQDLLVKKPDTFFTVSQTMHCPHCDGKVEVKPPTKHIVIAAIGWLVATLIIYLLKQQIALSMLFEYTINFAINMMMIFYIFKAVRNVAFIKA